MFLMTFVLTKQESKYEMSQQNLGPELMKDSPLISIWLGNNIKKAVIKHLSNNTKYLRLHLAYEVSQEEEFED